MSSHSCLRHTSLRYFSGLLSFRCGLSLYSRRSLSIPYWTYLLAWLTCWLVMKRPVRVSWTTAEEALLSAVPVLALVSALVSSLVLVALSRAALLLAPSTLVSARISSLVAILVAILVALARSTKQYRGILSPNDTLWMATMIPPWFPNEISSRTLKSVKISKDL